MEEIDNDKMSNIEYYVVLKYFEDLFRDIPCFPSKRYVDFSINLMCEATLVSKSPYRMITPKLKELEMKLKEILNKGYIFPSVSPWGANCYL
jgi:hypothetical protein